MVRKQNQFPEDSVFTDVESPVGTLRLIASRLGLHGVWFHGKTRIKGKVSGAIFSEPMDHPVLKKTHQQLQEYFSGDRTEFDLPVLAMGTEFQMRAWTELQKIPYGQTISYSEQARRAGNAKASRAIGLANGKNPIAIVVPCHRVVGQNGSLTGFAGGLEKKKFLLALEQTSKL